eukprot:Nk52_evm2s843 gene=Nk52_evmTU2s843
MVRTGAWGNSLVEGLEVLHESLNENERKKLLALAETNKANPIDYTIPYMPFSQIDNGGMLLSVVGVPTFFSNVRKTAQRDGMRVKEVKSKTTKEVLSCTTTARNGAAEFTLNEKSASGLIGYYQRRAKAKICKVAPEAFKKFYSNLKFDIDEYTAYTERKNPKGSEKTVSTVEGGNAEASVDGRGKNSKKRKKRCGSSSRTHKKRKRVAVEESEHEEEYERTDDDEDVADDEKDNDMSKEKDVEEETREEVEGQEEENGNVSDHDILSAVSSSSSDDESGKNNAASRTVGRGRKSKARTMDFSGMDEE